MLNKINQIYDSMSSLELDFAAHAASTNVGGVGADPLAKFESIFFAFKTMVMCELGLIKEHLMKQDIRQNKLEQYSRRNCLLIHGIDENGPQSEVDCVHAAVDIFRGTLNLEITPACIDRAHRIGVKKQDKKRPIIVKFVSYFHRRLVFTNKKLLKGSGTHITESLTGFNFQLLTEARRMFGIQNVWTIDGRIIIKDGDKKQTITTMENLKTLNAQASPTARAPFSSTFASFPPASPTTSTPGTSPVQPQKDKITSTQPAYNTRSSQHAKASSNQPANKTSSTQSANKTSGIPLYRGGKVSPKRRGRKGGRR